MRTVDFWFDLVSGYSWIAIAQAETFAQDNDIEWRLRGFPLGAVIKQTGRRTIALEPSTRGYAVFDVARHAHALGLAMKGPKEHPFVSLKALRAHALHQDTDASLPLARALFAACWEEGRDMTDTAVISDCVASVGLATDDLDARLRDPATKTLLKSNTDEAMAKGVVGAPFFLWQGEPFWGNDRLPLLAARLRGDPGLPPEARDRLLGIS